MQKLIEFFTKKGELVLDPFAGVGGTLLGASLAQRKAIGIEINEKWTSIYKEVCKTESLEEQPIIVGDCLEVMKNFRSDWENSIDFIITDPPYNVTFVKSMCNEKYPNSNRRSDLDSFSSDNRDFANSKDFDEYLQRMTVFLNSCYHVLRPLRYLVIIMKNSYQNGEYIMTSAYISDLARQACFIMKGEIIWYPNGNRLRPYGYPFVFVPNIIHHNILIFRKEEAKK